MFVFPRFGSLRSYLTQLTTKQLVTKLQALDYTISQLAKLQSIYIGEIETLMAEFESFLSTGDIIHAHLMRELPFLVRREVELSSFLVRLCLLYSLFFCAQLCFCFCEYSVARD